MSDVKLNPCPFCGSSNIQSDCFSAAFSIPARSEDCFDYCQDCDAQGPAASGAAEAHDRWNTRGELSLSAAHAVAVACAQDRE